MDPRDRLEDERRRALERLRGLTADHDAVIAASRDTNADDEHDPEGATIAFERSQVAAIARQVRARLAEIDAALARWDAGTYRECAECGEAIHPERLLARPATSLCIDCAWRATGR